MPGDDYEVVWHGAMGVPLSSYQGGSSAALAATSGPPVPTFTHDEQAKLHARGAGTPWRHDAALVPPRPPPVTARPRRAPRGC